MPPARITVNRDLMRGIRGGQPFYLAEQAPSVTDWLPYNAPKRSGGMGLLIWQTIAHGGDDVLFFQMRHNIGACEEYHGALMDHMEHEHTRAFREMQALEAQLAALSGAALGAGTMAKAAIAIDWDDWWALEYSAGSNYELKYLDEMERYYQLFFRLNIPVDIVSVEDDLEEYEIVVAKDQIISGVIHVIQNMYNPRLSVFAEV